MTRLRAARAVLDAHPRHLVLMGLVLGLLAGGWAPALVTAAALAAAALAWRAPVALAAVVAALGGGLLAQARVAAIETGPLPTRLGTDVALDVTLLEPLRERASGRIVARVSARATSPAGADGGADRAAEGGASPATAPAAPAGTAGGASAGAPAGRQAPVLLRLRDASGLVDARGAPVARTRLGPGDVLAVRGRLERLGPWDRTAARRGALAGLEATRAQVTSRRRGGMAGALDAVRRRAEGALSHGLRPAQAALLQGMVLGRDDGIDATTTETFRVSGLAHLLAVSGSNVMLLSVLVLAAAGVAGVPLRARLLLALVVVALYVPLTGAGPSIQRAGVMGACGLVAALAGRPATRWYALGVAAAVTLALNPFAAAEPGWQLSFAAVVGLLALAAPLRAALDRRGVPGPLAEATALTAAATIATAPLLAVHFEALSLASLPANVVVAPVVAPVMWLGMLAAAVAQVAPVLAQPLVWLAAPLVGFVGWVADAAAALPGAQLELRLPGTGAATAAGGTASHMPSGGGPPGGAGAAGGFAGSGGPALGGDAEAAAAGGGLPWASIGVVVLAYAALVAAVVLARRLVPAGWSPPRRPLLALLLAAGVALAALRPGPATAPPRAGETVVTLLDVGQGDATLLQRDGAAVLVDTGTPEGRVVDRLRAVGVHRLDALVLTHAEADHEGNALAVIAAMRPRTVVDGGAGWPSPVQRGLPAAVAAVGGRVQRAFAGDVLRFGALHADVLWPPRAVAERPPEGSANDRALVLHARGGDLDVLLTADAEAEVLARVRWPAADVLKVAHHGSDDAGLPEQLEDVRPAVAAIEVGARNTYGHPTPATMRALRAAGPTVVRTDRDGTVRLREVDGGPLRVERLRGGG